MTADGLGALFSPNRGATLEAEKDVDINVFFNDFNAIFILAKNKMH